MVWNFQALRREWAAPADGFRCKVRWDRRASVARGAAPCTERSDAKQHGHSAVWAICAAGRTYSRQESIEVRPLFQRDSFVVLRFSQETLLERTGELELLFFTAKGNHNHTFLYADHSSGSKRLMYYVDTGGNVRNIHRHRLRLLRSDWRRRHIGRTIGRRYMDSPAWYNRLLGEKQPFSLALPEFLRPHHPAP